MYIKLFKMKKLKKGDWAPNFNAEDYRNNELSLEKYRGKKVLLSFHAFGSCPFCNLRVRELSNEYQERGLSEFEMIHVFPSSKKIIGKFAGKGTPEFPIISDPYKNLFETYGVNKSVLGMFKGFLNIKKLLQAFEEVSLFESLKNNDAEMHQLPADFLIDENGIIQEAYYSKSTSDHLPIEKINNFINQKTKLVV